jgi:DNA-binding PadR family transcriptional regulator
MPLSMDQELYSGLIRLHVLHHACQRPVYGLWIIEELAEHGYKLSAGTLYPMLHRMEKRGLLRSSETGSGRARRRVYRATAAGRRTMQDARRRVRELFGELFEAELTSVFGDVPRIDGSPMVPTPRAVARKSKAL